MTKRSSRYASSQRFVADPSGRPLFSGLMPRRIKPATGILEHRIVAGERLDQLGKNYFNDDRQWWRIADANQNILCATDITATEPGLGAQSSSEESMSGRTILVPAKEE